MRTLKKVILFSGVSIIVIFLSSFIFFYGDIVSVLGLDIPKDKGFDHKDDTIAGQFMDSKNEGSIPEEVVFIYSHPYQHKSYFVEMKDQKVKESITLRATGLFGMIKDPKSPKDIWLWSDYTELLYKMDGKMNISGLKQMSPYTFLMKKDDITISGYNKDANDNVLEFQNVGGQKHRLTLPSLIISANYDKNYLYVFADIISEERSALYVIERDTGKLKKEISISFHGGNDIALFKGKVIINTNESLTIVNPVTWKVSYINLPKPEIHPGALHYQNNTLYLAYSDNFANAGVLKFNENFKVMENKKLNFPYMKSVFYKNKLYILSQLPSASETQFGGILGVFELDSWKKEGQIILPKRGHMVQDFLILD